MRNVKRITENDINRIVKKVIIEYYDESEEPDFKQPQFQKINSIKIVNESDYYYLVVNISIKNPSKINLKINEYDINITIDGIYLGNAEMLDNKIMLIKKSTTNFDVRIKLDGELESTINLFKSLISKEDHILHMDGYVKAGIGFISKKIDINQDFPFKNKGVDGLNNFIDKIDLGPFNYLKDDVKGYLKKGEDVFNTIKNWWD